MSTLPPPPLQAWRDMPPVWQRWFIALFGRIGETSSSGIGELDELIAAVGTSDTSAATAAIFDDIARQLAHDTSPAEIESLRARVEAPERITNA